MADINRKSVGYKFPQGGRRETDNPGAGLPRTTLQGVFLKGTATLEIDVKTGVSNNGVSDVNTELEALNLQFAHSNRPFGSNELIFSLPLPADSAVAAGPYNGDVNAYIADQITAGGNDLASLDAKGFSFQYIGNNVEGTYRITIPGDATDDLTLTANSAAVDNTLAILPRVGTPFDVYYQVVATDGTDDFYYGDVDDTLDIQRRFRYYIPRELDVDDDGDVEDVYVVADAANTSDNLTYVVEKRHLSPGRVIELLNLSSVETSGSQTVNLGGNATGGGATGLANDATTYTATINIDGSDNAVSVVGSAAQTYTNLISEINTDLPGTEAALTGGNIVVTSSTTGASSTVSITDTDLFSTLSDFVEIEAPVPGADGVGAGDPRVTAAQTLSIGRYVVADKVRPATGGPVLVAAVETSTPTDTGIEGEIRGVNNDGTYQAYMYLNGNWRQMFTVTPF